MSMGDKLELEKTKPLPSGPPAPEPAEKNAIDARGLGCRFGKRWVVRDLDLAVPEGSITALLGRNGAGKSTTIQLLLGLMPASAGTVQVLGLDPRKKRAQLFAEVGYVSEKRELLEEQTIQGLSSFVASVHGKRFDGDGFEKMRVRYKLDPRSKCSTLSKGQRARLLLSLAIAARPKLLVLDEPTSGLDVVVRDDFLEAIAAFIAEEPERAVLLSTHLIDDVARICDRAIVLREAGKTLAGEVEDLRASCSRYLVRLRGVLPGHVPVKLRRGAVITERDPRALTIIAHGAGEHLEAELDTALPVEGIERMPATLKEAFTCLTEPCGNGGDAGGDASRGSEARARSASPPANEEDRA
jgi:ABC-2 type transport system ATP-binding protein